MDGRVIVSSDADFGALLARHQRSQPSFVLFRHANDLGVDEQAALLVAVLPALASELDAGGLGAGLSVSPERLTVRATKGRRNAGRLRARAIALRLSAG